jgi:diguanylate cyclase (GGDEF)-like protein
MLPRLEPPIRRAPGSPMSILTKDSLHHNVHVLRGKASMASIQGVLVAVAAIVVATLAVTLMEDHAITVEGLARAQRENFALWILNVMPFVFAYWGQYSSNIIAYEASALVMGQTEELRNRANQLEKQARFAATHDTVTELPNRALFLDRLDRAIRNANSSAGRFAVLLLSVENLKDIHDTLGLSSGDALLKQLSTRLLGLSGEQDSVARIDNHSFGLLVNDAQDAARAEAVAHTVQKALEPPFMVNRLRLTLHTSIGIVLFPEHGEDPDTLLQRGSVAVYVAGKSHNGRALYSPLLDEHSPRRLTLMGELRHALERNQLSLHYQPKLDIAKGCILGAEALLRWQHPKHGFISPDEFIGLAERTRLIRPLTLWVIKQVFADVAAWHTAGRKLTVSINLSAKDLCDPELPDIIAGASAAAGIDPRWIVFEITESSIMTDPDRVLNVVERIHALGFELSIDDFGTGYSSLAYLKKLPVSELKIDKSFVMDMLDSDNDRVIVRATIDLAHNLGLKVTAEGVETRAALAVLSDYGCDVAQGYLLSKPQPADRFLEWLESSRGGWLH